MPVFTSADLNIMASGKPQKESLSLWVQVSVLVAISTVIATGLVYITQPIKPVQPAQQRSSKRLFTPEELAQYDGSTPEKPIYVAVLGIVFDVTKGARHYGQGGGYHFFAGRDASRAFVTGEFTSEGLRDDVDGLTPTQVNEVYNWRKFYKKDYAEIGILVGRYYDAQGNPTEEMYKVKEQVKIAQKEAEALKAEEKQYPSCNSRWNEKDGGEMWCDARALGSHEVLVPRLMYSAINQRQKCVCVQQSEANSASEGRFQMYNNCSPNSERCKT